MKHVYVRCVCTRAREEMQDVYLRYMFMLGIEENMQDVYGRYAFIIRTLRWTFKI